MSTYNIVLSTNESTVVTEYEPQAKRSDAYQSEAALESAFIKMLGEQGYEYVSIHNEADLVLNLRKQLERLNQSASPTKNGKPSSKPRLPTQTKASWKRLARFRKTMYRTLLAKMAGPKTSI